MREDDGMSERKFDVAALGKPLIDFTENGTSGQGNTLFEANPGGAPCNVLVMLKKLGRSCAFIGKVGDDMFGAQLRAVDPNQIARTETECIVGVHLYLLAIGKIKYKQAAALYGQNGCCHDHDKHLQSCSQLR